MKTTAQTILSVIFAAMVLTGCAKKEVPEIIPGAERTEAYLPLLEGKSVALAINNSSVINGIPILDTLISLGVNVVKIFSPEHGFRGGNQYDSLDVKTGIPVVDLYRSKSYKPQPEDFEGVDIMIFDMQDVGVRFYTYLSTMHYVMEACAENGKQLIILDRPNPNDFYVDGPVLKDTAFHSFVGMHLIPIVHGLTFGEYANMINDQGWLKDGVKCNLSVVEVANYEHGKSFKMVVDPSPNLNTMQSIYLYPSLCLFEGTVISQGRGTMFPFQVLGNPDLKDKYSFSFTPGSIEGMSKKPPHMDAECFGLDLREYDTNIFRESGRINLSWLIEFYNNYPEKDKFFRPYFDLLAGGDHLKKQIIEGKSEDEIRQSWEPELTQYKEMRKKYLLYKDFQ